MAKPNFNCKACNFKSSGPMPLGKHYASFPSHRPEAKQRNGKASKKAFSGDEKLEILDALIEGGMSADEAFNIVARIS